MVQRTYKKRFTRIFFLLAGVLVGQLFQFQLFKAHQVISKSSHSDGLTSGVVGSSKIISEAPNYSVKYFESGHTSGVVGSWKKIYEAPSTPKVFVVTPTYRRPTQLAELTRIAQAIYPARHFVEWLIILEFDKSSHAHVQIIKEFMTQFNISGLVLRSRQRSGNDFDKVTYKTIIRPIVKGVKGRRTAINFLRKEKLRGVVYFADDDNTYDSDIFRQMQETKKVSMWPVGCITELVFSSPILKNDTVEAFYDGFQAGRTFPIDFAEFALNIDVLHENPNGNIPHITSHQETKLLVTLGINKNDVEVLADKCTEVMAWHTKTQNQPSRNVKNISLPDTLVNSNIASIFSEYSFI